MAINEALQEFYLLDENNETFQDLRTQLAGLLGTTDTDFESLCRSPYINIWAKNRPFRYNSETFGFDFRNPAPSKAARDEARKSVGAGIVPYALSANDKTTIWSGNSGLVNFPAVFSEPDRGWRAELPRGAAFNEPFRMRDFDGYRPNVSPTLFPVKTRSGDGLELDFVSDVATFDLFLRPAEEKVFTFTTPDTHNTWTLDIETIKARVGDLYAGLLISSVEDTGGITMFRKKQLTGDKISDAGMYSLVWDIKSAYVGTYKILPVLWGDNNTEAAMADRALYFLPQVPMQTIKIIRSELSYSAIVGFGQEVTSSSLPGVYKFTFEITIYNPSQKSLMVNDNFIRFGEEGTIIGAQTVDLPDSIYLPHGNPYHTTIEVTMQTFSSTWKWPVFFSLNGGEYTHTITFE